MERDVFLRKNLPFNTIEISFGHLYTRQQSKVSGVKFDRIWFLLTAFRDQMRNNIADILTMWLNITLIKLMAELAIDTKSHY